MREKIWLPELLFVYSRSIVEVMIKVIIGKNENINRALKRFRVRVRDTKVIQNYKTKQEFIKKSVKRRREIQKAQYIQQLKTKDEQI